MMGKALAVILFSCIVLQLWTLPTTGILLSLFLNSSDVQGDLAHFWKSTGFCPPLPHEDAATFDLSPDMKQNLAYIGAVPHNGIAQVRVHWLFELVRVQSMATGGPVYDFTDLDKFVALMYENELFLGFELMGNPSNIYTDMENRTQLYWWKDLVTQTVQRYIAKYGLDYVKHWNFESWNEPDCHDFDKLKMTVQGFLNYYDACSEGLKAADGSLIFGGPADGCRAFMDSPAGEYSSALLHHVVRGKNYFTGETGVRIDFVSFHEKGNSNGIDIIIKETANAAYMKFTFPELTEKPYYNDEADPLVGWNKAKEWRADATYGALVAKIVNMHQNKIIAGPDPVIKNFALLSNDNGFLSWYPNQFTQRTLLARFQMNNTNPHYVTFIRKPVYTVMTMLSLLGEKQVWLETNGPSHDPVDSTADFSGLATLHEPDPGSNTSDSWQMALLLYGASDPGASTTYAILDLNWIIYPTSDIKSLKMMSYSLYNGGSNPYSIWEGLFNKTAFPSLKEFSQMRQQEDAYSTMYDVPVKAGPVPIPPNFQILDPHILVMHLCAEPAMPPEKVTDVRLMNVTVGQVMIVWSDTNIHTRCILTYEVELSQNDQSGPYTKVNTQNSIITLFNFQTDSDEKVRGHYRVRAVDYWQRGGEYSDPMPYLGSDVSLTSTRSTA